MFSISTFEQYVFSLLQDIEVMFEAYGIRVSSEHVYTLRLVEFVTVSQFDLLNKNFSSAAFAEGFD